MMQDVLIYLLLATHRVFFVNNLERKKLMTGSLYLRGRFCSSVCNEEREVAEAAQFRLAGRVSQSNPWYSLGWNVVLGAEDARGISGRGELIWKAMTLQKMCESW